VPRRIAHRCNRQGVWIVSQDVTVGFLSGISLDYFDLHNNHSTHLVLLSESLDAAGLSSFRYKPVGLGIRDDPGSSRRIDDSKDILNVMAVNKTQEGFYERVAVGQMSYCGWKAGQPSVSEVILG
jgi:hypothetical protein